MKQLSAAAVERAMKLQDVMLRAMAKRMQRWKTRFKLDPSPVWHCE